MKIILSAFVLFLLTVSCAYSQKISLDSIPCIITANDIECAVIPVECIEAANECVENLNNCEEQKKSLQESNHAYQILSAAKGKKLEEVTEMLKVSDQFASNLNKIIDSRDLQLKKEIQNNSWLKGLVKFFAGTTILATGLYLAK